MREETTPAGAGRASCYRVVPARGIPTAGVDRGPGGHRVTRDELEMLHDSGAFNPSPRHQELYATHVPFDTMTRTRGCEQALAAALRRRERVTLVGTSGAGKSSVIAATLHPLVEDLVPLAIPVAVERPGGGRRPGGLRPAPGPGGQPIGPAHRARPRPSGPAASRARPTRSTSAARRSASRPAWWASRCGWPTSWRPRSRNRAPPATRSWTRAGRSSTCSASRGLTPVLVLDDTDRWLTATWLPDSRLDPGRLLHHHPPVAVRGARRRRRHRRPPDLPRRRRLPRRARVPVPDDHRAAGAVGRGGRRDPAPADRAGDGRPRAGRGRR